MLIKTHAAAAAAALMTLALTACSHPAPEIVFVTPEPDPPHVAAECLIKSDPAYVPLRDSAVGKSDLVRQDDRNARVIADLKSKRGTCAASLAQKG